MPHVVFIQHDGSERRIEVSEGTSLMAAALNNGVDGIVAECGGSCSCATCHCYIDDAWYAKLTPPGDTERGMLEWVVEPRPNSRLGCQVPVTAALDGIVVHVPANQHG